MPLRVCSRHRSVLFHLADQSARYQRRDGRSRARVGTWREKSALWRLINLSSTQGAAHRVTNPLQRIILRRLSIKHPVMTNTHCQTRIRIRPTD